MPELVDILEKETGVALFWLELSEMIAYPEKFHVILLRKDISYTSGEKFNINDKVVNSEETVKLLSVTMDYKLDFDRHISNILQKSCNSMF